MATFSKILIELKESSLLAILPELEQMLLNEGTVRSYAPDAQITTEGEPITELIIPIDHGLRLSSERGETGYLQKHRALSLPDLIQGRPHARSAFAETRTKVITLPANRFMEQLSLRPDCLAYLKLVSSSPAVRSFRRFLEDRGIAQSSIIHLISLIPPDPREIPVSTALTEGFIHFVLSGKFTIRATEGSAPLTTEAGSGTWIGGQAIVPPHRLSYTAIASELSMVHQLDLSRAAPLFESLGLLEPIFDDPWIYATASATRSSELRQGGLSELPGETVVGLSTESRPNSIEIPGACRAESDLMSYVASVVNVCALHGIVVSPSGIESQLLLRKQASLGILAEILESLGVQTSSRKTSMRLIAQHALPALVMLKHRLVILLKREGRNGPLLVHDPARGVVRIRSEDFEKNWDGLLLETRAPINGEALSEQENPASTLSLTRLIARYRSDLLAILGLSIIGSLLTLGLPVLTQVALDQVFVSRSWHGLQWILGGLVLLILLSVAVKAAWELMRVEFSTRFDEELSTSLLRHALALPTRRFASDRTGSILTRVEAVSQIQRTLSGPVLECGTGAISSLVYLIALALYAPPLALTAVVAAMLATTLLLAPWKRLRAMYSRIFDVDSKSQSIISEQVGAITAIKALGIEQAMRHKWETLQVLRIRSLRNFWMVFQSSRVFIEWLLRAVLVLTVWIGGHLAMNGEMSTGQILSAMILMGFFFEPFLQLSHLTFEVMQFDVSLRKLAETFAQEPEQSPSETRLKHHFPLRGKIRLERIQFRHSEDAPWVIQDVDLTIYPRQVVAIVGASGCGKTTLANLIAGNLRPSSGKIYFDDMDSSFISIFSLRNQIGFINQNNDLFAGNLLDNIAYGDDTPCQDRIDEAAKQANASNSFRSCPGATNTPWRRTEQAYQEASVRGSPSLALFIAIHAS